MEDLQYRQATLIYEYLELIQNLKEKLMIFIAAKDTPGMCITNSLNGELQSLGLQKDFTHLHWHGYVAVIYRGSVVYECAQYDQAVECSGNLEDVGYYLLSGPLHCGNKSIININDINYCINSRGLNFVIYDLNRKCVTDSVGFDTHVPMIPFARILSQAEITNNKAINDLTNNTLQLVKEVHKSSVFSNQMFWQLYKKNGENLIDAKKRFFNSFEDNDHTLHLVHLCLVKLLKDFDAICRENNIQYWIDYGALLGAYRHGKCIPWDDDLDVGMMRKDILKLKEILADNEKYKIEIQQAYLDGYIRFIRFMTKDVNNPCFIDIFYNDYCESDSDFIWERHCEIRRETVEMSTKLKKTDFSEQNRAEQDVIFSFLDKQVAKEQEQINTTGDGECIIWATDNFTFWTKNIFAHKDLYPLKRVFLDGIECYAPNNIEKRLGILYGDFYSLPNDLGRKHINIGAKQVKAINDYLNK